MDRKEWLSRYLHVDKDIFPDYEWAKFPEVTISASVAMGQMASISVLKQQAYTGKRPVIPSTLADTPCSDLGIRGLLEKFNIILSTSYTLSTAWVYSVLGDCIFENFDFGTAYTYLRPFWRSKLGLMMDELPQCKTWDQKMRQDVLDKDKIICTHVPPRRVWDLCSNRVVPWWVVRRWPWAISHAWMNERDRENIMTPINGHEWPVPIPKDASLDLIRIEMLNLGAEYAWLDVLCLRQGGIREDLREEEWKVDVPTIGSVYDKINLNKVVCYLSGLGRPLSSDADDLESDRCWFKRAWTLQEISLDPIIGGDTGDEALRVKFREQLSSLQDIKEGRVYDLLSEMQKRVSTYPVDKIAGMAYIMGSMSIPAYYGNQSEADAWIALMDVVGLYGRPSRHLADLLFLHPVPGTKSWRPLWKQVITEKLPPKLRSSDMCSNWTSQPLICDVRTDSFNHGYIVELALVQGLSNGDTQEQERHGKFIVKDDVGTEHAFKIVAYHQCPIPDGSYTLLGAESWDSSALHCVVGWRLPDQRFKKLSVFEMHDEDIVSFLSRGIATKAHTTYLA